MFHTVYDSYESRPNGRDYIGKHSTDNPYDSYLGSYKDKTFNPDNKIAFAYAKTAEGAVWLEMMFQRVFDVVEDPQFANRVYQTSTGFDATGIEFSEDARKKIGKANAGKKWWYNSILDEEQRSEVCPGENWVEGRREFSEDAKIKMGKANAGITRRKKTRQRMSKAKTGERNPAYGRKWWVNAHGEIAYQVNPPSDEWQNGMKWKGKTDY